MISAYLSIWFDFLRPSQQSFSYVGMGLHVYCSRTQCSDAGEAWTHGPLVYYWATVLPYRGCSHFRQLDLKQSNEYSIKQPSDFWEKDV